MAIKNLPTRGYAFAGTIALVVTRGYGIGAIVIIVVPVTPENRVFALPFQNRICDMLEQDRVYSVPFQDRVLEVN